jgi:hypothetical protein
VKIFAFIVLMIILFGFGCARSDKTIKIKGIVTDEFTKAPVSQRNIIVHGLLGSSSNLLKIEAGSFYTDSAGCFTYNLRKIKNAGSYNFSIVGDSIYSYMAESLDQGYLERNAKNLTFRLNRLTNLTIYISRTTDAHLCDTLYLAWVSAGKDGRTIYPYKIRNAGFTPSAGLRWIGGNVNATISTRTFANHRTTLKWELYRKGRRNEIFDTITCKRDFENNVYFRY